MDDQGTKKERVEARLIRLISGLYAYAFEKASNEAKEETIMEDHDPTIDLVMSVMLHMELEDRKILLSIIEKEYSPIRIMVRDVFENARAHGFWYEDTDKKKERLVRIGAIPQALALIHSEISEALEESREPNFDPQIIDWQGLKPIGFPIELADAMIRIMDLAGAFDIDLNKAIRLKHEFNLTRPKMHGKRF